MNTKARLDSDRTAEPLTRLVAKVPATKCHTGGATHYEGADGQRVALQAKPDAFRDLLRAIGYEPRPYAHRAFERCWAIEGRGLTLGVVAGAVLDYEAALRLDPDARAMMIRAFRGARQDSMGFDVVLYFPTEKVTP